MATAGGVAALLAGAFVSGHRRPFLPGRTSDGHHLFEQRCDACHVPFSGPADTRCAGCHQAELKHNTHPRALFDDPRWAADLEALDATRCVTCHGEHRVAAGGVTVATTFCFPCHDDVAKTRPDHRGFTAETCSTSGCHNYHDGSTLKASFLSSRLLGPDTREPAVVAARIPGPAKRGSDAGVPAKLAVPAAIRKGWAASLHATRGVGCLDCHRPAAGGAGFDVHPGATACARCHEGEVETFHRGPHGVRESEGLAALVPADARLPMTAGTPADHRRMDCAACHDPHSVDTRHAAVDACLGCHDDAHSRAFKASPHGALAAADHGARPAARSVTCATCHLPRETVADDRGPRVAVNHNNAFTLRPRDRMLRLVCLSCHSGAFALNALFDDDVVKANFKGRPRAPHRTVELLRASLPAAPAPVAPVPAPAAPAVEAAP